MLEIKTYVREAIVDEVIDELGQMESVGGIAVVAVRTYGHAVRDGSLSPVGMMKLELDVDGSAEQDVVDCIIRHARTGEGHPGDGRVTVTRVHRAVRIRDGQEFRMDD